MAISESRATLCYIVKDGKILLIHKKRGVGAGKLNGPGGKVEPGETPLAAAIRETEEEIDVTPMNLRLRGELHFRFSEGHRVHCFVFLADDLAGQPCETAEAIPEWFSTDALPYEQMWEDDRHWLPLLLAEKFFVATVLINEETAETPVFSIIRTAH